MKAFAVFFLIETVSNIVAPPVLLALTSGPTAPEATSFEPVDTTDMVNTITGDFVYNTPLLEVPGPSGGYPLSLSYHAGISPEIDASWVGLGFTLNPGSVNRMVNGVPDDFYAAQTSNRVFWEGGETTVKTYGLSYGIGNFATVTSGLIIANDTYRGRGVGGYAGGQIGFRYGPVSLSANLQASVSPYSDEVDASVGVGVGVGVSVAQAQTNVNINTSGKVSTGLAVGAMGVSIDTKSGAINSSNGGFGSYTNNSKAGRISTHSKGFAFDIPVYYAINIHLGRDYTRYWQDERESYANFGSLFFPETDPGDVATRVFDSYHLTGMQSVIDKTIPQRSPEGSFPDYDVYSVNAQGLGGNFRPYHYALSLSTQDVVDNVANTKELLNYSIPQHSLGVHYRFVNDFSNRVLNDAPDIGINRTLESYSDPSDPQQDYQAWKTRVASVYGSNENVPLFFPYKSVTTGEEGFEGNSQPKRRLPNVPGSKHIEYFTNYEIFRYRPDAAARGFIECVASGFDRDDLLDRSDRGQVGAFVVTNSTGVRYHFALPAYASAESVYTQNKDTHDKISFNNSNQWGKYAYTWYLTGLTGPDYVDRGPDGTADGLLNKYDFGYWVSFEYGKWTDNFYWRNPAVGYHDDVDNRFQTFSKGKKELYYLNAIKTATHTAFFVKERRADGKGESPQTDAAVVTNSGHAVSFVDEGTFSPSKRKERLQLEQFDYSLLPAATLCLKSIYLFKNDDLTTQSFNALSSQYNDRFLYTGLVDQQRTRTYVTHYGENVLDVNDIQSSTFPVDKVLRRIDFGYDYSLAPGTINSFDQAGALYDCDGCVNYFPGDALTKDKSGKLTLKSVTFKGKNSAELLPPIQFNYDVADPASSSGNVQSINATSKTCSISDFTPARFSVGDIVSIVQAGKTFYGYLTKNLTVAEVQIISATMPSANVPVILTQTKNPPYSQDNYDMWGYYKCDYHKTDDRNMDRFPSNISARNVDAWSLRTIETSLGSVINIDYESDTYSKSVLSENLTIPLKLSGNATETTPPDYEGNPARVFLEATLDESAAVDFTKIYQVGDYVSLAGGGSGCSNAAPPPGDTGDSQTCGSYLIHSAQVQEVSAKYIRMRFFIGYETMQSFYGCVMKIKSRPVQPGGGLRVNSISLSDGLLNTTRTTSYTYEFNNASSGVTSYEPINISNISSVITDDVQVDYSVKSYLLSPFIKMMSLSRDVPAPAVYYGRVRVSESFKEPGAEARALPGYSEYEFQTFNDGMIDVVHVLGSLQPSTGTFHDQTYTSISTARSTLRDFTSRLGNLKSVTLFDNNGEPITKTLYHFLHDQQTDASFAGNSTQYEPLLTQYKNQGQIEEVFNHGRLVNPSGTTGVLQGLITRREVYPTIPTGTTSIQYKTGLKTVTQTLGFDFYSGQPVRILSSDEYGNYYLSETTPAYRVYPAMGLKTFYQTDQAQNKHMLDQEAAAYVYKVNPSNYSDHLALVSASAQTWTDQTPVLNREDLSQDGHQEGVWRKASAYSFIGNDAVALRADGLYPAANVSPFDAWAWGASVPAGWQKGSEITLYDVQSHALEARDINNHYAATRMLSDHSRVAATAANARYNEFAYSGAEDFDANNISANAVLKGEGVINTDYHHTGAKSLALGGGQSGFETVLTLDSMNYDRRMHLSFWIYQPALQPVTVQYQFSTGQAITSPVSLTIDLQKARRAGDWVLCETDITVNSATVASNPNLIVKLLNSGSATTYIDDFRIHSAEASIMSYVYNTWNELSHILDNNNMYTEYRYDGMGRLTSTYKETFQASYGNTGVAKTGEIIYNYGKKHPYTVSVVSSFTGPSGQLSPSGTVSVQQGRDLTFNIYESCSASDLLNVYVDNIPLNLNLPETTLFDGTKVLVQGNLVTFKGVLTNHTLSAQFKDYGIGIVECHVAQLPSGSCFDGTYDYRYYDACGVLGEVFHANTKADIPANLRGLAPFDNCKVLNGPTPCDNNNQN